MEKAIKRENTAAMTGFRAMVMTALFAALGYVATRILQIPTPSGGYVNLGDTVVILGAYLLGPVYGAVAGGSLKSAVTRIVGKMAEKQTIDIIVLKDNGEGLSSNETTRIFELNYQGSNRVSGNGLGLTQAKAIVEYYGGTIYAKSERGKGMGVYIQLPASSR